MINLLNRLWVRLSIAFIIALLIGTFLPSILLEVGLLTGLIEAVPVSTDSIPPDFLDETGDDIIYEEDVIYFDSEAEMLAWLEANKTSEFGATVYDVGFTEEIIIPENTLLTIAAGLSIVIGSILGILFSLTISRPLQDLVRAADAIGNRDLSYRAQPQGTSEMHALAQSFNSMASNLENSEAVRRNMMADVAHELRTPLSVLDGNLRAMLDDVFPTTPDELGLLYEQTAHLTRLVNDVRELSLAEAKRLPLDFDTVDLEILIAETVTTFAAIALQQDVTVTANVPKSLQLTADANRLRQVLHNLIANAVQHTPAGGRVIVSAHNDTAKTIKITVQDNGVGLEPERLSIIFDRFQRGATNKRRDRGGSTGLGLAIVKAIVELHHGTIMAASAGRNKGCIFTIELPMG